MYFILVDIGTRHAVYCSHTIDRQPQDQVMYCYFCLAYTSTFSITTKMMHTVQYQTLQWPIMPVTTPWRHISNKVARNGESTYWTWIWCTRSSGVIFEIIWQSNWERHCRDIKCRTVRGLNSQHEAQQMEDYWLLC
jgi:hypothetical protein